MTSFMSAFERISNFSPLVSKWSKAANKNKKIPIYGKKTVTPVVKKGCRDLTGPSRICLKIPLAGQECAVLRHGLPSNPKIRFQSFFMLITIKGRGLVATW
jgi:hypothetical protein